MQEVPMPDTAILKELLHYKMPFGKHKDKLIADLPVSYLEWFQREGFPPGKLGMLLSTMYEIQINGLGEILYRLRKMQ